MRDKLRMDSFMRVKEWKLKKHQQPRIIGAEEIAQKTYRSRFYDMKSYRFFFWKRNSVWFSLLLALFGNASYYSKIRDAWSQELSQDRECLPLSFSSGETKNFLSDLRVGICSKICKGEKVEKHQYVSEFRFIPNLSLKKSSLWTSTQTPGQNALDKNPRPLDSV